MTVVFVVQFVLLAGGLLWKGSQLARRPRDIPLWAVVGTFAAGLTGWFITTFAGGRASQPSITPSTELFWLGRVFNPLLLVYGIAVFYILASRTQVRSRLRVHTACLLTALSIGTIAAVTAPPGQSMNHTYTIYLTSFTYAGTVMFVVVVLTRHYGRTAAPRLRHGLQIAGVGAAIMSAACMIQAVLFFLRWIKVFTLPPSVSGVLGLAPLCGGLVFVIGLLYPATMMRAAATRVWFQHLGEYRRLAPLSHALHSAYPELALRAPNSRWWRQISPTGVHRRWYRRLIEIRDGLVRISPYLGTNPPAGPVALADRLHDALARRSHGEEAGIETVSPVALPNQGDRRAEVETLLALSDAMARTAPGVGR